MNSSKRYTETQSFRQIWLWLLLLSIVIPLVVEIIRQPKADWSTWTTVIIVLLLGLFFWFAKLQLQINEQGLRFRFWPFHLNYKKYNWSDIEQSTVGPYQPLWEFWGWGLRWSHKRNARAYSVSGFKALRLQLKNGPLIFIGTKNYQSLQKVIESINTQSDESKK